MSMTAYERAQYDAIWAWKAEAPSVVDTVVGTVLSPVTWVVNTLVPAAAIERALEATDWLAQQTLAAGAGGEDADDDLAALDGKADRVHDLAIAYATGEGAVSGAFGFAGIVADIPMVITLSLRTVRQVGAVYGYVGDGDAERRFVFSVLGAAGANSVEEKIAAVAALQVLQNGLSRDRQGRVAEMAAEQAIGRTASRALARQLGINLTKRKALQMAPLIGAGVGAAVNGAYVRDVGWAARRAYQERWLKDHEKLPAMANSMADVLRT